MGAINFCDSPSSVSPPTSATLNSISVSVDMEPTNQGVTQLKFHRNKSLVTEERDGRKLAGLKVLNSY